jgi:hypothetical protein
MYCIFSCNPIYFLKSVVQKMNYKIVKFGMANLTEKDKADVAVD